jgi:pimeloyl-ACP methyl ester carboxylesterase
VLDALGVDRAVVAGHSWGSHLALQLAVAHPDRVAGLLIIDGPGVTGDGGVTEMGRCQSATGSRLPRCCRGPRW